MKYLEPQHMLGLRVMSKKGLDAYTTLKGGNKVEAAESVERILRLAEGKTVCAGHEINASGFMVNGS
jgi:hypothetical protein